MKIIADDKIPFLKSVLEPYSEVAYLPGSRIVRDDLADADALLIRTRTKCNEMLLHDTPVKFIGTATIGFDHIDTDYCEKSNIKWTNAPGCNSGSVKQYVAAALFKLAHDHHFELKNKTLGILGVGNVGSKVEIVARALGMKVLLNDPPRERKEGGSCFVTFDTILKESDILTLHVPLSNTGKDKTFHLFNEEIFCKTAKAPWLINTSRGEVIETQSLKGAIRSGIIAGVILDVWENEPDIDPELLSSAFIATPHIAGYSADGKANGAAMVVNSLCRHFDLPLVDWYPSGVPEPENPHLTIACSGKSEEEIIREAVMLAYDISSDDKNLRDYPSTFEKQRGEYRLRREFPAFTVKLAGGSVRVMKMLGEIGFIVKQEG